MAPSGSAPPLGALSVHLARGPRPPGEVQSPPPWAYATGRGGVRHPDLAYPPEGPSALAVGWWGSAASPKGGGVSPRKLRNLAISMPFVILLVVARIYLDPSIRNRPSAVLFVATFTFVTLGLVFGFIFLSLRRRERKTYSTRAESRMRLDPGSYDLTAVAAAIDAAVRYRVPASTPRPPPPSCVAEWSTSTGSFVLRLWRGAAGSLPMIELESALPYEETNAVKGAVEAALYG